MRLSVRSSRLKILFRKISYFNTKLKSFHWRISVMSLFASIYNFWNYRMRENFKTTLESCHWRRRRIVRKFRHSHVLLWFPCVSLAILLYFPCDSITAFLLWFSYNSLTFLLRFLCDTYVILLLRFYCDSLTFPLRFSFVSLVILYLVFQLRFLEKIEFLYQNSLKTVC